MGGGRADVLEERVGVLDDRGHGGGEGWQSRSVSLERPAGFRLGEKTAGDGIAVEKSRELMK
jgi:hypothetical protein